MAEHLTVCGGHLSAEDTPTQLFSHAKFGDVNYDNKEDCDWIIEASEGKNVHLSFVNFELEDEQDCGYDFIEVSLKFKTKTKREQKLWLVERKGWAIKHCVARNEILF